MIQQNRSYDSLGNKATRDSGYTHFKTVDSSQKSKESTKLKKFMNLSKTSFLSLRDDYRNGDRPSTANLQVIEGPSE